MRADQLLGLLETRPDFATAPSWRNQPPILQPVEQRDQLADDDFRRLLEDSGPSLPVFRLRLRRIFQFLRVRWNDSGIICAWFCGSRVGPIRRKCLLVRGFVYRIAEVSSVAIGWRRRCETRSRRAASRWGPRPRRRYRRGSRRLLASLGRLSGRIDLPEHRDRLAPPVRPAGGDRVERLSSPRG